MVWSHQDFARELHRQLVEIASIRKRVEGNPDLLERLGRLEESHHYLLRKLQGPAAARATASRGPARERFAAGALSQTERSRPASVSGEPRARVPVDECFRNLRWTIDDLTQTAIEAVRLESRRRDPKGS